MEDGAQQRLLGCYRVPHLTPGTPLHDAGRPPAHLNLGQVELSHLDSVSGAPLGVGTSEDEPTHPEHMAHEIAAMNGRAIWAAPRSERRWPGGLPVSDLVPAARLL